MIYICIPAYDEAPTIGLLLWKIRRVMDQFPRDYELLVLDDGSADGTQDVLAPYSRVLPLSVLRNPERQGYASSVERLLREVTSRASHPRRDIAITLQADFSESPEDIPALVKRVEGGADLVGITSPDQYQSAPRLLRWSLRSLPWLLRRAALPAGIDDPLSGFRAYRVAVLKKALTDLDDGGPLLTGDRWAANVELLMAVAPYVRRAEAAEVPVRPLRRRRETRFRPWKSVLQLLEVARRVRRAPVLTAERSDAAA